MDKLLSPAQVARALQVSESSVKRWCDHGAITMERTVGGHRRIALPEVLKFVQSGKHALIDPEVLGLPANIASKQRSLELARKDYEEALNVGAVDTCREIIFDLFLANHPVSVIGDEVIGKAFQAMGDGWECGDVEVYQERRGCEVTARVLHDLLQAIPNAPQEAPLALGGTAEKDIYTIPTLMVELVLKQLGFQTMQLGSALPVDTIVAAINDHQPKLVWLSVSHIANVDTFLVNHRKLYEAAKSSKALVVGGRALSADLRKRMKYTVFCDTLAHLESFSKPFLTPKSEM